MNCNWDTGGSHRKHWGSDFSYWCLLALGLLMLHVLRVCLNKLTYELMSWGVYSVRVLLQVCVLGKYLIVPALIIRELFTPSSSSIFWRHLRKTCRCFFQQQRTMCLLPTSLSTNLWMLICTTCLTKYIINTYLYANLALMSCGNWFAARSS